MFNPVIIVAIIIQGIVSKASRMAGAILGYIITTSIFIWGLSLYSEGDAIALFGARISQEFFIIACLVWFGFDTMEFIKAKKGKGTIKPGLLKEANVVELYQNTMKEWSSGKLSGLNKGFEKEGKMSYDNFVKGYAPVEGSALDIFFSKFPPIQHEFLIGIGDSASSSDKGWFTLTNLRLILKDGLSKSFKEINLADIENFESKGIRKKILTFKMKSGETIEFNNVEVYPDEKYMKYAMQLEKPSSEIY